MVQCLPIVVYINGSFIKNRIAVKPIYITVTVPNLSSAVSGKSFVWQVQGMARNATCFEEEAYWRSRALGTPSTDSDCIVHA